LTSPLEPTNEPYALAKILGVRMCQGYRRQHGRDYISVMPTNLYGPNDNYNLETSHVLPALIRKFHEAKRDGKEAVILWGTGKPQREFLQVDDLADACFFLLQTYDEPGLVNIGTGEDIPIKDLAHLIAKIVGYEGKIEHDLSKPDGTPRKLMDVSKLKAAGWQAKIGLEEGIRAVYEGLEGEEWF
ncbi:MAG: NAD-dependent epimerase/dehydratase family protein, partial [Phaeodactylibacter sp.]|nr:NAD-dependent epimerase/dehydratase family protein [Phaeodactylibacter sp.]